MELGTGNASASPNYKSSFSIGDEVEVAREEVGYSGARYEAIIVELLNPTAPARNPKSQNKKRGFWVQYKHLLSDEDEAIPKRWWTGVVVSILGDDDGNGCRFRVAFKNPDEELECYEHDLRFHLDWVGGNWVRPVPPHEEMPLLLGTSSAALDLTIKRTTSSKKKLEICDTRTDGVQPPKKLKSIKHTVKALENQEFPRPLLSRKAFTRKPRILGSVDNQSSHATEESNNCSSTEVTRSSGDCNNLIVEECVDRELNREDIENVVDVGILAPCVHSLKHTGDKDGKLSDSGFQIVEGSREKSTMDLSDHRSLAVTQGSSAAAVQPCSGTTTEQPNEMPNASVTTPEPRLVLPFKKNSALWRKFEYMEVVTKNPQNPHFSPSAQYEETKREEVALLKMTKYVIFVERIQKLTVAELNSSTLVSDMLDSVKDLEEYGFDLMPVKHHLHNLLLNKEKQTHLRNKLEEEEGKIRKCYLEKAIAVNEINMIALKIKDLEKELMSVINVIETIDNHIELSRSLKDAICDDIRHINLDFEGVVASVKQIFI